MTRLLCTADWHSGAGREYGREPGDRLADQAAAYQTIAQLAIEHHVDAVLFAGDLTHHNHPTPAALGAAKDALDEILEREIRVLAISGNSHDVAHVDERIGLELVQHEFFRIARRPQVLDLAFNHDPDIWPDQPAIACLPWAPDTRLMAASSDTSRSEIRATMADHLVAVAARMRADIGDRPAILMLHYSVAGGVSASGAAADLFGETVLPLAELVAQRWTAVVCGHLHKYQVLSADPLVFYPGPPAIVDFGEADHPHGCVLLDIDDQTGRVEHTFIEIPGRPFLTVECDLTSEVPRYRCAQLREGYFTGMAGTIEDEIREHVASPMNESVFTDAVVRLRYTATPEQARLVDHQAITQALLAAGAHKVFAIQPTIERADRGRLDEVLQHVASSDDDRLESDLGAAVDAGSLTPLQAIEAWIHAQGLNEETAAALRARTTAYLEGQTPTAAEPQEAAA